VNYHIKMPSLLSYLELTDTKFRLNFSLISQDVSILEKSPFPFLTISESDPFARLIDAQFATDAGSEIKRVFLLFQKDEYHLTKDELRPFNNRDVDQCWQKAFSFYSKKNQDASVFILNDQIGENGGLVPLQSLFFCKSKRIFFHPPCPVCGLPLQQCRDDDILTGLGFQRYSASLKRYLFCPSCFGSTGKSDFYVFSLENSDQPVFKNRLASLKDRWDLIKDFGRLTEVRNSLNRFPCINCSSHQECYGPDGSVISRITPVSFYPFYMLIFEAASINALDFLPLISGASFDDLENRLSEKQQLGRMNCLNSLKQNSSSITPFFFDKNEKYFLEVLYLKLSFLCELVQAVFSMPDDLWPGLSIDSIWINLTGQNSLLPFFWNFKLKIINIEGNTANPPFLPKLFSYDSPHLLGIIWFYTFLVNKKQGVSEIYAALGEKIDKIVSNDDDSPESVLKNSIDGVFSPANIFWIPDEKSVGQDWVRLWEKAIGLGWSLLKIGSRTGLMEDSKWSKDKFQQKLKNLRKEVKDKLFSQNLNPVQAEPVSENKAIHEILARIMGKWSVGTDMDAQEDELEKTVVISTADMEKFDNEDVVSQNEYEIEETMILSPADFIKEKSLSTKKADQPEKKDFISETVILYPDQERSEKR